MKLRPDSTPSARGHVITFPDNAPEVVALSLPRVDVTDFVKISFVGSRDLFAKRTATGASRRRFLSAHHPITVDVARVYRALRLKKALDPNYANIEIDDSEGTIQALQQLSDNLLDVDNVLFIDSAEAVRLDALVESNVARPESADGSDDICESVPMTMEHIFVHPPVTADPTDIGTVLRATDRAVHGVDESVDTPTTINVDVDGDPVNEFKEGDLYFLGGFPFLFLMGQGIAPGSAGIPSKLLRHMLLQYSNQFACNAQFLFTVFNQLQRHAASRSVSLRVKGGQWSMQNFTDIINEAGFSERLVQAIADPTTSESKALANAIMAVTRVPGAKVPWSVLDRKSAMSKLMAIMQYCGAFSIFGTIAPADMDSILMLKLSCRPPSSDTGSYAEADASITLKLPGLRERHRILSNNPAAAAQVYKRLVENLFSLLIGIPTSHTVKKSPPPVCERGQGVLGVPIAFGGVTEGQARHSPHLHFVLVTDLTPMAIQTYCDNEEVKQLLCARLDSMLRSQIPPDAEHLATPVMSDDLSEPTPVHRDARKLLDYETASEAEVLDRANAVAYAVNRHAHTLTCHKGATGRFRCRLAMDRTVWSRPTEVLQLIGTYDATGKFVPQALKEMGPRSDNIDPLRVWNDHRVLVLELHRPHATADAAQHSACPSADCALQHPEVECTYPYYVDISDADAENMSNGKVVTFSPALSAILGCNTDIEPLGTFAQAKSAIFYLVKYLTKDGHDLANVLSLIKAADDHCMKYPSRADDSGTADRNTKYILTRLLNCLSGEVEVGAQLASLALLDFPSNVFSHEFFYCFITPAINYCKRIHRKFPPTPIFPNVCATVALDSLTDGELLHEIDRDEDIGQPDDAIEAVDVDDTFEEDAENNEIARNDDDEVVFISQAVDYKYRAAPRSIRDEDFNVELQHPSVLSCVAAQNVDHQCDELCTRNNIDDLAHYSLYEYTGIVLVRPRAMAKSKGHRQLNKTFEFHKDHPLAADRVQQLRSKQCIPLLAGRPSPPHPGPKRDDRSWELEANRFAAYAITLHHPWSLITLAPPIPLTWNSLEDWVQRLMESNNYLDKARLLWLRLLAHGRTVKYATNEKLLSGWRARSATYWSKNDRIEAERELNQHAKDDDDLDLDDIINEMQDSYAGLAPVEAGSKAALHRASVLAHLRSLNTAVDSHHQNHPTMPHGTPPHSYRLDETICGRAASIVAHIARKVSPVETILLGTTIPAATNDTFAAHVGYPQQQQPQIYYDSTLPPHLNESQAKVFQDVIAWANADAHFRAHPYSMAPAPLRLLISGAAGTGKTHTIRKLFDRLGSNVIVSVSITGVAASHMPQGTTIHSKFALPVGRNVKPSDSAAFHNFGAARIVVIDEISSTHADVCT